MTITPLRRTVQVLALLTVLFIPVFESYKLLLTYLPENYVGTLWDNSTMLPQIPAYLKAGYLSWLMLGLDKLAGSIISDPAALHDIMAYFGGTFWSVTVAGVTVLDPLAFLQILALHQPFSTTLLVAGVIPLAIAVVVGRMFCSWVCPVNTLLGFGHFLLQKTPLKNRNLQLISSNKWRYVLLVLGVIAPLAGYTVFPYILPYAVLGRSLYYLTTGIVFVPGLIFLLVLLGLDLFVQKGLWCNYLCPTGGVLSLLGRKRLLRLKRNETICNEHCSMCKRVCHWQANPKLNDTVNCTNCNTCIERCPTGALGFRRQV